MRVTKYLILVIFSLILTNLPAANEDTIAVVEFKNKSEGALRFNGTDMAAWMSYQLKESGRFKPADRKAVAKIVKNSKWLDDRLSEADEAKLQALPAKYALYGYIINWRSSIDSSTTGTEISQRMRTKVIIQGVLVLLHFELIDLASGKSVKTFQAEGSAGSDTRGPGPMEGSASEELAKFDSLFEEASKTAIRKAANTLSNDK